jgi:hypothetical protein
VVLDEINQQKQADQQRLATSREEAIAESLSGKNKWRTHGQPGS